jgi:hypothetical protein
MEWIIIHVKNCWFSGNLAVKTHNEVTPFYRHFEPSETFGTDSHQVRNTITGKVDACADVFPRCTCWYQQFAFDKLMPKGFVFNQRTCICWDMKVAEIDPFRAVNSPLALSETWLNSSTTNDPNIRTWSYKHKKGGGVLYVFTSVMT